MSACHRSSDDHRCPQGFEPTDLKGLIEHVKGETRTRVTSPMPASARRRIFAAYVHERDRTPLTTVPYKRTARDGPTCSRPGRHHVRPDDETTKQIQAHDQAYAVTSPQRLKIFPRSADRREAGLAGFQVGIWHGHLCAEGHAGRSHRPPLQVAAEGTQGRQRGCPLRRARHRAVERRPTQTRRRLSQARKRDRPLEAGDRGRRPVRRLIARQAFNPVRAPYRGLRPHRR